MTDVEKVAIPDAAVEAALVAWYAEHGRLRIEWPDGIPSPHRASRAQGMRAAIQAALAAMGGEAERVEQRAREVAKRMFFGLEPIDDHDESDTYLVSFDTAVKHIAAAIRGKGEP